MTEYVKVLLVSQDIGSQWGLAAYAFSWILLQGYVVFPSTFTAYNLADLEPPPAGTSPWSKVKKELFYLIQHVPLWVQVWLL